MRILALVPGGIRDQILFFPTLDDLKHHYPQATIDVIAQPAAIGAYRISKTVRRAIPFDFSDRNSLADWGNFLGVIREQEYEAVITARVGWGVGLILWLSGIPTRIGYGQSGTGFLTHNIADKPEQYVAHRYHDLLQGFGLQTPCPDIAVSVPRADITWAETTQAGLDLAGKPYLLVYPSTQPTAYPVKNWASILKNLQERQPELLPLIVQSVADPELLPALQAAAIPHKAISIEDMGKLAALAAGASLVLCSDGEALHIAIAVQAYTIALLGNAQARYHTPDSDKFRGLRSATGNVKDIVPQQVLDTILG
ncbi:MAG: glycosyltransferase family 9 protein [Cyanobacteria bacterium P01_H01_bin.121]